MSDFNQSSHSFHIFISELISSKVLEFEDTLFHVYLPDLNAFKGNSPYRGVRELFVWLNDNKKVKKIKNLNIPDNTTTPMSDSLVAEAILDRFEIQKLDWRKLDINLDVITDSRYGQSLTNLTLYSSGNGSVLHHWQSEQGLKKLSNVCVSKSIVVYTLGLYILTALFSTTSVARGQDRDSRTKSQRRELLSTSIFLLQVFTLRTKSQHENTQARHIKDTTKYAKDLRTSLQTIKDKREAFNFSVACDKKWVFPREEFSDFTEPFVPKLRSSVYV